MLNQVPPKPDSRHRPIRTGEVMGQLAIVRLDTPLSDVAGVLLGRNVESAVVVDRTGTVRGVVTERHLTLNAGFLRRACLSVSSAPRPVGYRWPRNGSRIARCPYRHGRRSHG
jgi:hypothetical protein